MLRKNNGYMPDVLDCLANLSNDEVFTPPEVANKMLDLLPQELFESKDTKFLDPFTKSGVFLREITKRLLKNQLPDYETMSSEIDIIEKEAIQNAVKNNELDLNDPYYSEKARKIGHDAVERHERAEEFNLFERRLQRELNRIFSTQVFGIAITELTAQLARRSLYCSKNAAGKYSVSSEFDTEEGNIRFKPMKHTWKDGSCIHCGANKSMFDRPDEFEQHAYEFIHNEKVEEIFMGFQFDVICGNPPFQLNNGGGAGDSATPIYDKFIEQAKKLNPRYLTMIIPSKWMSGNILKNFRNSMMDKKIRFLYEYEDGREPFPSNNTGSICYFLWDKEYCGDINFTFKGTNKDETKRILSPSNIKNGFYIRTEVMENIFNKIKEEPKFSSIVSSTKPFNIRGFIFNEPLRYKSLNLSKLHSEGRIKIYGVKGIKGGAKRISGYINDDISIISKNRHLIDKYKIFFSTSYSVGAIEYPEIILGNPNEICSETFLAIGPFDSESEMFNCAAYMGTKFFKALLNEAKLSVRVSRDTFNLIPIQDFSKPWTDEELYKKYNLTQIEIDFIESMIKPMDKVDAINEDGDNND